MPQSKVEEFACSDGSSGVVVNGQLIYRTECSARSNAPNACSRLKLLVGKIIRFCVTRFSG